MTAEDEERAERIAKFDAEADAVRSGWIRKPANAVMEAWERAAGDRWASVIGFGSLPGPGYWTFSVCDAASGELIEQGESSRRGWAMDGADAALPVLN